MPRYFVCELFVTITEPLKNRQVGWRYILVRLARCGPDDSARISGSAGLAGGDDVSFFCLQ